MKNIGLLAFLSIGVCTQLSASPVSVGYILLSGGGVPVGGEQELQLFNLTGTNCDAVTYTVCDGINFTDWTLNVAFTQGGVAQAPINFTGTNPADNIGPLDPGIGPYVGSGGLSNWTFDQSCLSLNGCPPDDFDTIITAVTFTASVSSTTFHLFDAATGPLFFSQPTFTLLNWAPGNPISDQIDLVLDEAAAPSGGTVPEPSSLSFILFGLGAIGVSRLGRRPFKKP